MKKILSTVSLSFLLLMVPAVLPTLSWAQGEQINLTPQSEACEGAGGSLVNGECQTPGTGLEQGFKRVINALIFIVGAISVLMLIIGGIRFAISSGNEDAVKGARNTILYAIIGIVVAFLAYAIVNFVIGRISGGG